MLRKVNDNLEELIGGFLMVTMVISIFIGVFTRYVLNDPAFGTGEIAKIAFTWVIFLGASSAIKEDLHIGVDAFSRLLPDKFQTLLSVLVDLFVLWLLGILCYHGWNFSWASASKITPELRLPYTVVNLAFPIGSGLAIFRMLPRIWRKVKETAPQNTASSTITMTGPIPPAASGEEIDQ